MICWGYLYLPHFIFQRDTPTDEKLKTVKRKETERVQEGEDTSYKR